MLKISVSSYFSFYQSRPLRGVGFPIKLDAPASHGYFGCLLLFWAFQASYSDCCLASPTHSLA